MKFEIKAVKEDILNLEITDSFGMTALLGEPEFMWLTPVISGMSDDDDDER